MSQDLTGWRRPAVLASGAWREALRVSAPRIEPAHLFLGLLGSGGPTARVAAHQGLSLHAARRGAAIHAGRQLRAVGTDVARAGTVPRAPLARQDRGGAATVPLSPAAEALTPEALAPESEPAWALALLDAPDGGAAALVAAADVDVSALRTALAALDDATLPDAALPVMPAPRPAPDGALLPPDGVRAEGERTRRAGRATALGAEWFLSVPAEHVLTLLRDPARVRAVTAQPEGAEVDEAFGVVTTTRERGSGARRTRQLFPAEHRAPAGLPEGARRLHWAEVLDEHRVALDQAGRPAADPRDFTGLLVGAFDFLVIPDDAPHPTRPVDYPGHRPPSTRGCRVRLVRVRRTDSRVGALADRALRWPHAWALTQHLQSLASLAADAADGVA